IRNMINHTSGLRDWGNIEGIAGWPRTTRVYTHANVLEIVSRQHELNYPPGAEYSYSNTGFNLAAILVSRVSGEPFPKFERENIFNPLDMSSTQWRDDFQRIVHNRAIAYTETNGVLRMLMPFEDVFGNGGLLTTVGDLLRWNHNFTNPKVGGPAMLKAQIQQGRLNDGRTIAYAAGLMVLHWKGLNEVSHSGSTAGYRAWLGRYPDNGLSVAVLCNVASANADQFGHDVADIYLANVLPSRPAAAPVTVDDATMRAESGLYQSVRDHETVSVDLQNGHLQIDRRGAMKPISPYVYQLGANGPQAEFVRDAIGKVVRLRMATEVDEGNYYEKVERSTPSRADLEAMTGEYSNDEAETILKVTLEPAGLVIHRRPDTKIALTPTYRDGFSSSLGSVRFMRDSQGQVIEMSIGEQRVWDIRFKRIH
ncbi:MAG TPA: serine hydrolase, partial [Candidatus Binataceae bacterium]|nr:serine hydrolase [Candidatus Binataceae bacterium]